MQIRRRNLLQTSDFPYATHAGEIYDTGDFARMLEALLKLSDWQRLRRARRAESRQRGKLRGRGLSTYLEWTGALPTETVDIEVDAEGNVTVFSGTQAMGQGLETSYVQLITEVLQIPAKGVTIVQGDTDRANGVGSVGSRSAFIGGSAVVAAGRTLIARGKELAADALEAAPADIEFRGGRFFIAGTDRSVEPCPSWRHGRAERRLRVSATQTPSTPSWPNGAQACEVEIDPETGVVELVRISSVDDIGRIINHMIVEGQIQGGIAQGVGQALYEQAVYDESGQLLTGSLMDYCVPRADQFPPMVNAFDESVPCQTNLLGVKGCGEIGTIGAVPAVVHAVLDALAEHGVRAPRDAAHPGEGVARAAAPLIAMRDGANRAFGYAVLASILLHALLLARAAVAARAGRAVAAAAVPLVARLVPMRCPSQRPPCRRRKCASRQLRSRVRARNAPSPGRCPCCRRPRPCRRKWSVRR